MILASRLNWHLARLREYADESASLLVGEILDHIEEEHGQGNREAWLRERGEGIGGSDAAACVGCSPWKSSIGLWAEKAGRVPPSEPTDRDAAEMGRLLEPVVLERFRQLTGHWVEAWPQTVIVQRDAYPWQLCTPDALIFGDEGAGLVQAKTARETEGGWDVEEVPIHYEIQVQHEMAVTGLAYAFLVVLFGGRTLRWYRFDRNEETIDWLTLHEGQLWQHVERGEELPPHLRFGDAVTRAADVLRLHPDDNGCETILPPELADVAAEYEEIGVQLGEGEKRRAKLKALLIEGIGPHTYGVAGGRRFSLKTQERAEHTVKASKFRVLRQEKR